MLLGMEGAQVEDLGYGGWMLADEGEDTSSSGAVALLDGASHSGDRA